MEISESMRRAGWRECPDDAIRDQWYAMGGYWQTIGKDAHNGQLYNDVMMPPQRFMQAYDTITRPINATTLDYDPRGWGEQPAPVVPTDTGLWWRRDCRFPVAVRIVEMEPLLTWIATHPGQQRNSVEDDGQWLGPCVKPEAPNV